MSNLFHNRLSVTISDGDMQALRSSIYDMESLLPFTVGLTETERKNLPKINRENKLFVDDAVVALRENGHLAPAYVDAGEIEKDITLFEQLSELEQLLLRVLNRLSHTRTLAGSEAYQGCLSFYRGVKDAAALGFPGAESVADRLGRRFKLRRNTGPVTQAEDASTGADAPSSPTDTLPTAGHSISDD